MKIRPATPADVSAVLPMVAKICALHSSWDSAKYGFLPHPDKLYAGWLVEQAENDRSVFLVAEIEASAPNQSGSLAAFLIATVESEIPIYSLKEFGFIHDLWVEPNHRSTGIGRQMVEAALTRFADMGIQQIRLDTAAANEPARQLFQSCGFRISTIEMLTELGKGR
jgi:ribosomal protein S18 acetylase RimI-like enzyme